MKKYDEPVGGELEEGVTKSWIGVFQMFGHTAQVKLGVITEGRAVHTALLVSRGGCQNLTVRVPCHGSDRGPEMNARERTKHKNKKAIVRPALNAVCRIHIQTTEKFIANK